MEDCVKSSHKGIRDLVPLVAHIGEERLDIEQSARGLIQRIYKNAENLEDGL